MTSGGEEDSFKRCKAFIDSNFIEGRAPSSKRRRNPVVTISRLPCCGSHEIGEALLALLEADAELGRVPWGFFDRDLVHRVLEDHHLPERLARYMPEDKDHELSSLINEMLGLHPSLWELFHHTCDTILKLAQMGNVILIGRGAHVLTRGMPWVLRVRVVAPFEYRLKRAMEESGLPEGRARRRLRQDDQARAAYIRTHFNESVDDPYAYDLALNTANWSPQECAGILLAALRETRRRGVPKA
ncbi:MAG: hypothetical protein GVY10_11325 [Verrucomicrobia bacterium]|jgi:hypothetical protein|nr:hypothetical protein [Verrucomicrobiota bacterium]